MKSKPLILRTGRPKLVSGFADLKADGSTACGCWIYSGVFPEPGRNRARERIITDNPVQPDWGFAWPHNRRLMYNRASADPEGRPWSERKKYIWWDLEEKRWVGDDEPDFQPDKPPDYRPAAGATGMDAIAGNEPFIMKPDGVGWLFAPGPTKDGPFPTHYEPVESPVGNRFYPAQPDNPTTRYFEGPRNPLVHHPTDEYPIVACTFRLTEHYLSGPMSRFNSWLNELQPEMFVELSPELADGRGVQHGGWLTVRSSSRRHRGAGDGDAPPQTVAYPRPNRPSDWPAIPLGLRRRVGRRQRQRSNLARRRSQREYARR